MHSKLALSAALMGVLAQVSTATTCTPKNAVRLEDFISSGGGGSGGGGVALPSVDPFKWVSNAVKKRTTPDAKFANVAVALTRRAADSVECASSEICLSLEGAPFCLDMYTYYFHDGVGTSGNLLSGDYTLADGRKGNLYNGPFPQPTGAGGGNAASATTTKAEDKTTKAADKTSTAAGAAKTDGGAADLGGGDGATTAGETGAETTAAPTTTTGAGQSAGTSGPLPGRITNGVGKGKSVGAAVGGIVLGALLL